MDEIKVVVQRGEDSIYRGTTQNLPWAISAHGDSLEGLKANIKTAIADYIETAEATEEVWAKEIRTVKAIGFKMNIESFFQLVPEVKITSIARKANINPSLMRQYATGKATVSEERLQLIEQTIHELGEELLSVKF